MAGEDHEKKSIKRLLEILKARGELGKKKQESTDYEPFPEENTVEENNEKIEEFPVPLSALKKGDGFIRFSPKGSFSDITFSDEEEVRRLLFENINNRRKFVKILSDYTKTKVYGQDFAIRNLAEIVYYHYKNCLKDDYGAPGGIDKENLFFVGGTGTGKTFLIETVCDVLNIPFHTFSIASTVSDGIKGKSYASAISELFKKVMNSDVDVEDIKSNNVLLESLGIDLDFDYSDEEIAYLFKKNKAERGIVFIDEFDKLANKENKGNNNFGNAIQNSLLRLIGEKGDLIEVETSNGKIESFSTQKVLFIAAGSFEDEISDSNETSDDFPDALDFEVFSRDSVKEKYSKSDLEQLALKSGINKEIIGRFRFVPLNKFDKEDFAQLLLSFPSPEKALLNKIIVSYFKEEEIKVIFDKSAKKYIIDEALKKDLGVRGLKSICNEIKIDLKDYFDNLNKPPEEIIINESFLREIKRKDTSKKRLFEKVSSETLRKVAFDFYDKGELDEAGKRFLELTFRNPDIYFDWFNLGIVYFKKELLEKAKNCFKKSIELFENDKYLSKNGKSFDKGLYYLAKTKVELDDPEELLEARELLLKIDEKSELYSEAKQFIKELDESVKLKDFINNLYGTVKTGHRAYEKIEERTFFEVIERVQRLSERFYSKKSRIIEARNLFEEVLKQMVADKKENESLYDSLAKYYSDLKNYENKEK